MASSIVAGAARADEVKPVVGPAGLTCDFFEAQLIGVLCGGTGYAAPEIGGDDLTINRTTVTPPRVFHGEGSTRIDHWDDRQTYEDATVAVSPWQGVRFHVTGEAFQYDNRDSYDIQGGFRTLADLPTRGGGGGVGVSKWTGAYGGWQTVGAELTVLDKQTETGRYVLDVVGGVGFLAGGGVYQGRDRQQIGWTSGAQWRLGGSGLSLDYYSETLLQRFDNPGEMRLTSQSRLLLASDRYGVALGPALAGTSELWHAAGYDTGWSAASLGAEALAEPFRLTQVPVLRDMTLDLKATHSIGQAELVPVWAGKSSSYDYAAVARFNFHY